MSLFAFLLRASRGVAVLSILAGIGSGLGGVGLIALIHAELGRDYPSPTLLAWSFAGLCIVATAAKVVAQASLVRLAQRSVTNLAAHLARRILSLPLRQFEEIAPASLLAVLTDDTVVLSNALLGVPVICINLPIVLACLAYVGWLSPAVLGAALVIAVPGIAMYNFFGTRGMRQLKQGRAAQDTLVGYFRELIEGFRELKIHRARRHAFLDEHLQGAAETVRDRNTAGFTLFALANSCSQLVFFGFMGFVLFVLPAMHDISRQALSGAILVTLYIMSPLEAILTWIPILGRARVSMLKIRALDPSLEALDTDDRGAIAGATKAFRSSLELQGVTYSYQRGSEQEGFTLGPIDLVLQPEELVIVAGGNGSGKTTLVKLLTGLYSPDSGTVRLDGRPVTAQNLEDYRQHFSAVFADGHLFRTLMGLDPVGLDVRAREMLARFELDGLVQMHGGAFSTTDLSQGQRKRLALLSALLEERPILVLDEWTSNQDSHFKRIFYYEILPELRAHGKTLVIITHDEDYFHIADRVIKLESGRTCESQGQLVQGGRD